MKGSGSESKLFQSRSTGEILSQARRKERLSSSKLKQAFLIDSDAEFFMYLIHCIRFGSWKVRRLNQAQNCLNQDPHEYFHKQIEQASVVRKVDSAIHRIAQLVFLNLSAG